MIIYEATDRKHGELNSLEFTESNKNYFFSSVSRLDLEGKRSLHSHDFYELTIVLEGELHLQIENETVAYHAGECCLCNKNIRHKELHDSEFEIILFMFQEEYIKSVLEQDLLYDEEGQSCTSHTFSIICLRKTRSFPFTVQRSISISEERPSLIPMIFTG